MRLPVYVKESVCLCCATCTVTEHMKNMSVSVKYSRNVTPPRKVQMQKRNFKKLFFF